MRVLITGATGYIGGRLIPRVLELGHDVTVLVRDAQRISGRRWFDKVRVVEGDLLRPEGNWSGHLHGYEAAYYLVHSMFAEGDFSKLDRAAAEHFCHAAADCPHVIYLGGLTPEGNELSQHLASRAETGNILREHLPTTEFQAGPIIGSGSASFEMLRYLTERLPVMVTPKWVNNRVRPIAVRDILSYLLAALEKGPQGIVPVGMEETPSYKEMMQGYAAVRGFKRTILPLPVLTPRLAARWVGAVTPITNRLAIPLVEGILKPLLGDTNRARALYPEIVPISYEQAVRYALDKISHHNVETSWSGALGEGPTYRLSDWEGTIREERTLHVNVTPEQAYRAFTSLGGETGWLVWNWAWKLRGWLDSLIGGPGLRRGRRHPSDVLPGEAIDFWRVEEATPNELLRLRAEMKLPGQAWLQFECFPEGTGTRLVQVALFRPQGFPGYLYWNSLYPVHKFIFSDMIRAIGQRAERM